MSEFRGVQIVGGVILALVAIWFFLIRPGSDHRKAVDATIASKVAASTVVTAKDATATAAKVVVLHDHTDTVTHENTTRILSAPGASSALPADVGNAWLQSLCMRDVYQSDPACIGMRKPAATLDHQPDAGGHDPR